MTELLLPLALGPFDLARLEPRLRLGERICQLAEENLELRQRDLVATGAGRLPHRRVL